MGPYFIVRPFFLALHAYVGDALNPGGFGGWPPFKENLHSFVLFKMYFSWWEITQRLMQPFVIVE